MTKGITGKTVYSFSTPVMGTGRTLYVNVVPNYACTNHCHFCSKDLAASGQDNIYERKAGTSLWLQKRPTIDQVVGELRTNMAGIETVKEIAFVGLGEPLIQLDLVLGITQAIRGEFSGKVRVDTNGLVEGIFRNRQVAEELRLAGMDEARISVNALDPQEYQMLCRPRIRDAFERLRKFVRDCIDQKIEVYASFVVGFDNGIVRTRSREEYLEFAMGLGIGPEQVIIREFVPSI